MRTPNSARRLLPGLSLLWASAFAHAEPTALSYEDLVARLGSLHPEYRAMQGEVQAASAAIDVANALPDPEVRIELMEIDDFRVRPDQVGSTKYTVEQMFPLWGKRALKRDVAVAGYQQAQARAVQTLAELRAMLRVAYAEIYAAGKTLDIYAEVQGLLEQMALSARQRYANGIAAQQDVIKARAEQTMLRTELEEVKGRYARAGIVINSLVGEPLDAPVPRPGALPDTSGFPVAFARHQDDADAGSPALAIADREVQKRRATRELAARDRYPDLRVGLTPVQTGSSFDSWELMLGVSVPLYGGTRAMEREQVAMLASAEDRRRAEMLRLHSAAAELKADYDAALARQKLFDEQLLPESEINLRSALAGYQNGQLDFGTLIEAGRQLRTVRLQSIEAAVQQQIAVAQFEKISGVQP